ncbi:MAG TPA: NAD(P)H-hydrate dehydratase [Terriglobales bacterium]|nr:NAD(P)H-hydrate dehydratase [Terriglobales bacterium]
MRILTARQMRDIDRETIEGIGIPGPVLMENAGLQVVKALQARFPRLREERVVIVAGKGNNGGDGLVVARHLEAAGVAPKVLLVAAEEDVKGDAALNLAVAARLGIPVAEVRRPDDWRRCRTGLLHATVIVDALFGTGLMKPLEGLYARVVEDINRTRAFKLAVDIPSGLSSDTFELIGPCVRADLTVCLAAPKIAHVFPPAETCVGELVVAAIGIPPALLEPPELKLEFVEKGRVRPFFRKRKKDTHKGNYGHLLVVAGSLGKAGAAALAGRAALKTGAGLVTVATAAGALPGIARSMMELMTEPLAETLEGTVAAEALPRAVELLEGKDGVLLGPGLSTRPSTAEFVLSLLPKIKVPLVIDADGLNILSVDLRRLRGLGAPAVLTPHPGEFARLTGRSTADVLRYRLEMAPEFARQHSVHLVLKGYRTLTAAPDGRVFVNPTGNPGMATGGSGDVLGGMIASEIVQEKDMAGAVLSAVYAHGLAGDLGAEKLGEKGLTAGDIIRFLPAALRSLEGD